MALRFSATGVSAVLSGAALLAAVACASGSREQRSLEDSGPPDARIPDAQDASGLSDCELRTVIQYLTEGTSAADCGHLPTRPTREAARAANACASQRYAAGQPFTLTVQHQGFDSTISSTYVGVDVGGRYVVLSVSYDSMGLGPTGANVIWNTCTSFSVNTSCDMPDAGLGLPTDPCVTCQGGEAPFCACLDEGPTVSCSDSEPW